jgi:RNA polymerase sigma-70 factor (ECF subfamily)
MIAGMDLTLVIREMATASTRNVDDALPLMGEDEFRAFYERTARPLWSYLSRITGSRSEAEDLLQEAFYRFYRAGARHESEAHRRNSLFQIATNLARDVARRGRRVEEVPLPSEDDRGQELVAKRLVPEEQAAIRTDLSRALLQIEPLQREMLWLAYAQGASHEEIGAIVGVRAISVRTLLLRARRKVAKILSGDSK